MIDSTINGVGVGLRQPHYQQFINAKANIPWLEILSDNYMFTLGVLREKLCLIREQYPMVMHSVGLNIGSVDPLNIEYLSGLKNLADQIQPAWVSDHLCWTGVQQQYSHDLLPLPYTQEALAHVVERVQQVQEFLQRPLLLENVSSYLSLKEADYNEAEFLNTVATQSGCKILLDVNNIFVSAHNHGYDPEQYLQTLNAQHVQQCHLAGFTQQDDLLIDTHGAQVDAAVWDLYRQTLHYFPHTPTNIEWDNNIPAWDVMQAEVDKAAAIFADVGATCEAS
jgi:uncharacterized protein (UPF0276 family)